MRLGIAVRISKWLATVHYTDCHYYRCSLGNLEIPVGMPVRLCRVCRPTEEDVRAETPEVSWYPYSHSQGPPVKVRVMLGGDMRGAEVLAARRDLGIGRIRPRATGWST